MPTTAAGIWTPDAGDDYALTTDLAAMASSIDNAIAAKVLVSTTAATTALTTHAATQAARMASGRITKTGGLANGTGAGLTVQFPPGRFTVPPIVMLTTNRSRIGTAVHSIAAGSAHLYLENWSGGNETTDIIVEWVAFQMTPTSATG